MAKVLVCVAWPYASGPRHLGHAAGCYLPADVVARYHRIAGDEVFVVSGSDCHGTPVTVAAEQAGVDPRTFALRQHEAIARTFARLGLHFDNYATTLTPEHERRVHDVYARLVANGYVQAGEQDAAWCPSEQRALPDRYVEGRCPRCAGDGARGDQCDRCGMLLDASDLVDPRCLLCGGAAALRRVRQLFLRLDLLQPTIERFLSTRRGWRPFVLREALGWVREGLRPRAITRDLAHGVPVPDEPGRSFYVWFEDVIGYRSASPSEWWEPDVMHRYFIGKDNIPFHTVWWPAILAGAGETHLPDDVVASHHLMLGSRKVSASRGTTFTLDDAVDRTGVDAIRHALSALRPETADVEFTWARADDLTRTGLVGDIANPVHRVASLLWRRFGGVPAPGTDISAAHGHASTLLAEVGEALRAAEIRRALRGVWELGRVVNRRLAASEPWRLPDTQAHEELTRLLPYLDGLGVAAWPFVPETASRIRAILGRATRPSRWAIDDGSPLVAAPPAPPLTDRRADERASARLR